MNGHRKTSTRREFLVQTGCAMALAPTLVANAATPSLRCPPVISGNLWWYHPDSYSLEQWRTMLLNQKRFGFDLLWLSNVTSALDTEEHIAKLRGLMDLAETLGFQVILDTGFTGNWFGHRDLKRELETCGATIDKIGALFGQHPAFFGWYIPHEIYMAWGDFAEYIDQLYSALVKRCKAAADKPVTVSPFFILDRDETFGTFRYNEPDEYRDFWEKLLKRSGIDILMLQDSGEHFSYVTNTMRHPFYEAMLAACQESGATLWGNVECAEFVCESPEKYVELYGKVHHVTVKNAPWRAVPIGRMEEKLTLAAEYCERIVTWGYQQYGMPSLGEKAQAWCRDYEAYYKRLGRSSVRM